MRFDRELPTSDRRVEEVGHNQHSSHKAGSRNQIPLHSSHKAGSRLASSTGLRSEKRRHTTGGQSLISTLQAEVSIYRIAGKFRCVKFSLSGLESVFSWSYFRS